MPVPSYDQFMEPILRFLATRDSEIHAREAHEAAAQSLELTHEDKTEVIPSGQATYKNRAGWANDRLKRAGFTSSPRHGYWQITELGKQFLDEHPAPIADEVIKELAKAVNLAESLDDASVPPATSANDEPEILSPEEQLHQALSEIEEQVTTDLLERLAQVDPVYFETIVLDLLHAMGYGASRKDLKQTQASGDGGIDGIISLDKLGLEKVYVQAKRWQNTVGRPELQSFYGALAGRRATKGIFLTTSLFSRQAEDFAAGIEGIVLVDGPRLARLMIEHEVGVSSRKLRLPEVDSDYFAE